MKKKVSIAVVRRLPRYYRYLRELMDQGVSKVSSGVLARSMGLTASQIRQDFNCFGDFGQQGYGYNVEYLHGEIGAILGLDRRLGAIIVGVGNLGRAIAGHISFEGSGFRLCGLFDVAPGIVGNKLAGIPIMHVSALEEFCAERCPDMAVLTLPAEQAPAVAERLSGLGVQGFWNFSNLDLNLGEGRAQVEHVHLSDSLMTLCYRLSSDWSPGV